MEVNFNARAKACKLSYGRKVESTNEAARLSGRNGIFRSNGKNAYQAENDFEALRAWIESVHRRGLPKGTLAMYTREVERFMLWAVMERKTAMSSMEPADFVEYEAFLVAPPAHWRSKVAVKRLSIQWRPMRGPLRPNSIMVAMTVVRMLYHDWHHAGYLRADPTYGHESKAADHSIYWLTTRDWQLIEARMRVHAYDVFARRTRAAMLLMRRSHLQQQDVVGLVFESLVRVQTPAPGFAVPARDGVLRHIDHETWAAIEAHFADRIRLIAETSLGRFENVPDATVPLIGAIVLGGVREVAAAEPIYAKDFPSKPNVIGSIRQQVLAHSAWQFFEDIAHEMTGEQAAAFLARARSWLDDPSRQTPERRKKILLDKALGNATHEFVDEPKQEELELLQLFMGRPTEF
ncbi:MAG: hypothetical protein Q8Q93_15365 [Hydrogenophaga sp.]|nr:hypothetical protein [Hydrogenophaga sp.]